MLLYSYFATGQAPLGGRVFASKMYKTAFCCIYTYHLVAAECKYNGIVEIFFTASKVCIIEAIYLFI